MSASGEDEGDRGASFRMVLISDTHSLHNDLPKPFPKGEHATQFKKILFFQQKFKVKINNITPTDKISILLYWSLKSRKFSIIFFSVS